MTRVSAKNNKARGKVNENRVADRFGGTRHWADTGGKEDVSHPVFSIQVKSGKRVVNNTIRKGLHGVKENDEGKVPLLAVVDCAGTRLKYYVVIDMDDFIEFCKKYGVEGFDRE